MRTCRCAFALLVFPRASTPLLDALEQPFLDTLPSTPPFLLDAFALFFVRLLYTLERVLFFMLQ